jgi:four helix bundle protein
MHNSQLPCEEEIATKEARETHYWLRLIKDSQLIPAERIEPLIQGALEIKKILSKTVSTTRKNLAQPAK